MALPFLTAGDREWLLAKTAEKSPPNRPHGRGDLDRGGQNQVGRSERFARAHRAGQPPVGQVRFLRDGPRSSVLRDGLRDPRLSLASSNVPIGKSRVATSTSNVTMGTAGPAVPTTEWNWLTLLQII